MSQETTALSRASGSGAGYSRRITIIVLAICWATVIADGFDVVVFGVVVPSLLADSAWGLNPASVGLLGSMAVIGMFFGSIVIGTLTDRFGRRPLLILCVAWFSVFTALCAVAPTPEVFGVLRFVAGFALGGVMPTASALTAEYSAGRSRNLVYGVMWSGFPLGGILAAIAGLIVIPLGGWRPMFLLGLVPLIVIVPIALKLLPESAAFLLAKGRRDEAQALAAKHGFELEEGGGAETGAAAGAGAVAGAGAGHAASRGTVRILFSSGYARATISFWLASFVALFMIYGLNTWLPQIMRTAGYSLGSALGFLLVYNIGAILGLIGIAFLADRFPSKPVIITTFLTAATAVALLSIPFPTIALYVLVIFAGAGALGTQAFINAWVSKFYPVRARATALGWALGIGRLGSVLAPTALGLLVASSAGVGWNFYAIAIPGVIGAIAVSLVPALRAKSS